MKVQIRFIIQVVTLNKTTVAEQKEAKAKKAWSMSFGRRV